MKYERNDSGRVDRVRRSLLAGLGAAIASPGSVMAKPGNSSSAGPVSKAQVDTGRYYPPALTGLRGSNQEAIQIAHDFALGNRKAVAQSAPVEAYDLVIVGGGISGLSAAHFYLKERPNDSVLILENHDDFGGHARRNEFSVDGVKLLGNGGSQTLTTPGDFSEEVNRLLRDLHIDLKRFETDYDKQFYARHGLGYATYFDAATYGRNVLAKGEFWNARLFVPYAKQDIPLRKVFEDFPLDDEARQQLVKLADMAIDTLPGRGTIAEQKYLHSISYEEFLTRHAGVTHPQALAVLRGALAPVYGHGANAIPADEAFLFGMPGIDATSMGRWKGIIERLVRWQAEPYIHHFPDGNSSVARALVRKLVPDVARAEDSVDGTLLADFDYSRLDRPGQQTRIRLNATVLNVDHDGRSARPARLSYSKPDGTVESVTGKRVVLACYNHIIRHICPQLPTHQKQALAKTTKAPLVYTNVALRNWEFVKRAGVGVAHCPGSWHSLFMLDFPVSIGRYQFSQDPSKPIIAFMATAPARDITDSTLRDAYRKGRFQLLGASEQSIGAEIRRQLSGMFGEFGFDADRDIAGFTANRWGHGYTYELNPLFDPEYYGADKPHELGRQRFGPITVANCDAGGVAMLHTAVDQAHRAINEFEL